MPRISELSNEDLMLKLDKYIKIYNKLENERQRRIEKFGNIDELLTEEEKDYYAKEDSISKSSDLEEIRLPSQNDQREGHDPGIDPSSYQVDFDEDELKKIQETCSQQISDAQKLQTITKILNLSDLNLGKDKGDD